MRQLYSSCIHLNLVYFLGLSDDYIVRMSKPCWVYSLSYSLKCYPFDRFLGNLTLISVLKLLFPTLIYHNWLGFYCLNWTPCLHYALATTTNPVVILLFFSESKSCYQQAIRHDTHSAS